MKIAVNPVEHVVKNVEIEKSIFSEQPHELSRIKKVIGVVSGKGGVGKSMVTSLMAVSMKRQGYNSRYS